MAEAYTSEDFEREIAGYEHKDFSADQVTLVALRIAAAVTKPGVIEAALGEISSRSKPVNHWDTAAAVRAALLKDSSNG